MDQSSDTVRGKFEAWAQDRQEDIRRRRNGEYLLHSIKCAWEAWQASTRERESSGDMIQYASDRCTICNRTLHEHRRDICQLGHAYCPPSASARDCPTCSAMNKVLNRQRNWCLQARLDVHHLLAMAMNRTNPTLEDSAIVNDIELRYRTGETKVPEASAREAQPADRTDRCKRCGIGFDTNGDGDCGYCYVLTDAMLAEIQGREKQARFAREAVRPGVTEELVVTIARELYDRFVMGGWEPQDAYPQLRALLGVPVTPPTENKKAAE